MSAPTRIRARMLLAGVLAIAGTGFLGLAPPASAQAPEQDKLTLRRVDSTNSAEVLVAFRYDGDADDVAGLRLQENGEEVDTADAAGAYQSSFVMVFDTSASTDQNATLAQAKQAAETLIASRTRSQPMAVVTAGSKATVSEPLTTDEGEIRKAIDVLTPGGDGSLYEAIVLAARRYDLEPKLLPTIVVISDGNSGGTVPVSQAVGAVIDSGAQVLAIGVQDGDSDLSALAELAERSGGRYIETDEATDIPAMVESLMPSINGEYVVKYASPTESRGVMNIALTVGETTSFHSYVSGGVTSGASALAPVKFHVPASGFFTTTMAKLFGLGLVLVAGTLAVFGVASIFGRDESTLARVLKPYSDGYVSPDGEEEEASTQPAFVQRAVQLTEQFAESRGFLVKVESALERANLPLRAGETLVFAATAVLFGTLLVAVLSRNLIATAAALGVLLLTPVAVLNFLAGRRKKKFEGQLPDMLTLLAGTLRAGFSLMQGVEAVSQEVDDPMGKELRRVVTEARLGRPLEAALEGVAQRMGSLDFAWAVMAIRIQREVGGNLAELLLTVAETMTQRERLRRDVRTLTAEGRVSAIVLGILPVGLGIVLWTINPEYIGLLFTDGMGQMMLGGGLLAAGFGYFWMTRIIKIEI